MPKLPIVSSSELIKAFRRMGFEIVSQKGSHIKMRDSQNRTAIIPSHKMINKGTLKKGILNPLGITVEELIKLL